MLPLARVHLPASFGCYDLPADLRVLVSSSSVDPPPSPATTESGGEGVGDFLSFSFIFIHFLSFSFIFFHFRSFSFILFHFVLFSFIFFPFLSFSFIFIHFLFIFFHSASARCDLLSASVLGISALSSVHSSTLRCLLRNSAHPPYPPPVFAYSDSLLSWDILCLFSIWRCESESGGATAAAC